MDPLSIPFCENFLFDKSRRRTRAQCLFRLLGPPTSDGTVVRVVGSCRGGDLVHGRKRCRTSAVTRVPKNHP